MATAPPMSGKGILFVNSRISRPDTLDEKTFMKWYEEDHIAEIMETSGIRSARRFIDTNPNAEKPYLAMYPMDDIGFTQSDEFRAIRVKSDMLPPPGLIYDMADFDVRYDNLIHVYDETRKGKGATRSLIAAEVELKEGVSAEEFDQWYREEHCPLISKSKGFLRSTRFKLAYARTNAQSRVLKGLAPETDEPLPEPATWLSLHEFECEADEMDLVELGKLTATPMCEKMVGDFKQCDTRVFRMVKEFGEKDWFHGVEM
ncbi:hypothetical protein FE257_000044 [Aspergillus nanangensis]|uniref:EthD domain-containing protein n=1 Tax=Aspergillus nanangensis TaxID=2582783 RepID=A0AAD4D0M5_ASPNN|nr:hypothetical protein FE257_000044 [Aspergillus nanangensis]